MKAKGETVIAPALTVGEVVNLFNIREFTFTCEGQTTPVEELTVCVQNAAEKANKQPINAFQLMMSGGSRRFPDIIHLWKSTPTPQQQSVQKCYVQI